VGVCLPTVQTTLLLLTNVQLSMLLSRQGWLCVVLQLFTGFSAVTGPKLDLSIARESYYEQLPRDRYRVNYVVTNLNTFACLAFRIFIARKTGPIQQVLVTNW